jgi:hypothetical protein
MPITLDGTNGITTPMYNGSITANAVTPSVNMKNRIINGAMVISQRNGTSAVTLDGASAYTLDRWQGYDNTDGSFTVAQTTTAPTGFNNSLKVTVATTDTSLGATQFAFINQFIEGYNIADLGWGTANAKTVTVSFWVYSSLTGTFGGSIINDAGDRGYPFSYTISAADTWEQKTVTIAGDTTGTWGTTNGTGLALIFGLGVGSSYSGTAGSWQAGFYVSATGATNVMATNGATFFLTGVQLEVGSTATSFDYRPYGTELALCQRYYWKQAYTVANNRYGTGIGIGDTTIDGIIINLPVTMRSSPTNSVTALGAYDGTNARNVTALNTNYSTNSVFAQQATADGSFTAGKVIQLYATGSTSFVASSAEL